MPLIETKANLRMRWSAYERQYIGWGLILRGCPSSAIADAFDWLAAPGRWRART